MLDSKTGRPFLKGVTASVFQVVMKEHIQGSHILILNAKAILQNGCSPFLLPLKILDPPNAPEKMTIMQANKEMNVTMINGSHPNRS